MKLLLNLFIFINIVYFINNLELSKPQEDEKIQKLSETLVDAVNDIKNDNKLLLEKDYINKYKEEVINSLEMEYFKELLISLLSCKTFTDKLIAYLKEKILYNISFDISVIISIIEAMNNNKEKIAPIVNYILYKIRFDINIFSFEMWIKIIRNFIERIFELPKVSVNDSNYIIFYKEGKVIRSKNIIKYYKEYNDVRNYEILNSIESFSFYIYKLIKLSESPYEEYIINFSGSTINKLFDGFSPISYFYKDFIYEKEDIYIQNLLVDIGNASSRYLLKKIGLKLFFTALKNFFGPLAIFIDIFTFSYKLASTGIPLICSYFGL